MQFSTELELQTGSPPTILPLLPQRESPLSLHYKLFEGTHVPDIVSTSGKATSGAVSKDDLIADLKDTCKVLETTIKANTEKKIELERLIRRLTEKGFDDGEEGAAEEEEGAAEETESDADDDSDATP